MIPLNILKAVLVTLLIATGLFGGCEQPSQPPPPEEEPYFQPGEYGGDPLEGTEHLYNLQLNPDGNKIALLRAYTPEEPFEPRSQLWIINADGTEPQLIGYNVGTMDWSPDSKKLSITFMPGAPYTYSFTIQLDSMKATIWSGLEGMFFSKKTVSNPRWFSDNKRLLISVWAKAYQQPYERGLYILDTSDGSVDGPLVEIASAGFLGSKNRFVIAKKYLKEGEPLSGNYIKFDFSSQKRHWITKFSQDSLHWVEFPRPNPEGTELIFARYQDNAWQLFMMDSEGNNARQLTELGGSELIWSKDGRYAYFNRDMHKAPGARYIPHSYELATGEIEVLWPDLPDSVPQFPPLDTQQPIDFYSIVQNSASSTQ